MKPRTTRRATLNAMQEAQALVSTASTTSHGTLVKTQDNQGLAATASVRAQAELTATQDDRCHGVIEIAEALAKIRGRPSRQGTRIRRTCIA